MALQSEIEIYIGGKQLTAFKEFRLEQRIDAHHHLEVVCRMDVLEQTTGELSSETKNFLGEVVTIKVGSLDGIASYKELEFKGVVTSITSTKGFQYQHGDVVVIKAMSTTVITDDGPHYASFSDMPLSGILDKTFQDYDKSKVEVSIDPVNTDALHYSVQGNMSAFRYASRLAAQYGEWFYYDGKKLVFGRPEDGEEVGLTYGHDLQEFSLDLNPSSNNYKFFTNDYLADDQHEMATASVSGGGSGYNDFTSQKSDQLFSKETSVFLNSYTDPQLKQRLDTQVEAQKRAGVINQVRVSGMSDNPGVSLGKVVKIQGDGTEHGTFRVIKVSHTGNENGMYQNRFEGVTAEIDAYPNTNITAYPKSDTQIGTVTDTADPDGYGRVKVQLAWQKPSGEYTPWLRVLTPHAGGEKGFHFIPEIGEEVLVGFEGGNAERPFVMGALYTGSSNPGGWKTEKNDIKAIRTRSGHTLSFSDEDGKESITISDKNGNTIVLDTVEKGIVINAPDTITLASKEINIMASETVNIDGTNNVNVTSQEILNDGTAKVVVNSAAKVEVGAPSTLVEGQAELKMNGAMVDVNGTAMTNVKGGLLNLNCG